MADRNLELALRMRADLQQARRQLQQVERDLEGVGDEGKRAGRETSRGMDRIRAGARAAGAALAAIGVAAGVFTAISRRSANAAVELERMAQLSNTNVEAFQRLAVAANKYNIPQEKLADILKDTNDRIGDFLTTGGGELADFMEQIAPQIGLTADELARMSGPEALQAVYNGLEQAGLSASEMTFYMESLADEATALIPLLRNNGAEMKRLGDEADRTGAVLSQMEVQRLSDLRGEFASLERQLSTETARAVSQFDELMTNSLDNISSAVDALAGRFNVFMDSFREAGDMRSLVAVNERIAEVKALLDGDAAGGGSGLLGSGDRTFTEIAKAAGGASDTVAALRAELRALEAQRIELQSGGGGPGIDTPGRPTNQDTDTDNTPTTPSGSSGQSAAAREYQAALQALQDLDQGLQQQIATFGDSEAAALEYRLTLGDLADDVARLGAEGEALAASIVEQAREVEALTQAEERRAEAEQQRQQAQQLAEQNLQQILNQADPTRGLQRQLELIDELKRQFPEYADALGEAAGQVRGRIDDINNGLLSASAINAEFAYGATDALSSFAEDIANGKDAVDSLGNAFRQFASDFLLYIAQMIMQQSIFNALQSMGGGSPGGIISGLMGMLGGGGGSGGGIYANVAAYHSGGIAGEGALSRRISADAFTFAPRYHSGGMAGLAPDEVPAILRKGEEVLTDEDPRHRNNLGDGRPQREMALTVVNTFNADEAFQAGINTPAGERALFNKMGQNRSQIRSILGL